MRLLISDANILIDMEAGALLQTLFRLPMQFGIPDLLYYEEIEPGTPGLEDLGLQIMEQESCTLLTGDANLRVVASKEEVTVMGTIGMLCAMVENQLLTVDDALMALRKMKDSKRRLPWPESEQILEGLR